MAPKQEETGFNIRSMIQPLLLALIVAAITTIGTVRVVEARIDRMERSLDKLIERLDAVAMRQASAIATADTIHQNHEAKIRALEARR